ncbi:uncharacterized protein LOC123562882 [Mercenaria mercenaria]|uniref:uncharacterized protein LOC123562882 n=1 Tax=Mercenaria mercenaria TaxID=6596 RepID=UPI00234F5F4D|nr:uncharacterized protein LOC123562882 [Mercenaria mercenaria]
MASLFCCRKKSGDHFSKRKRSMQLFGLLWLVVSMTSPLYAYKDGVFEVEKIREGLEDILIVKNKTGKTVAVIDVFADGEYQLVKPIAEDDYVCYVSRFEMQEHETTTCYERVPLPKGEEDQIDLRDCEDREVIFLHPTDCEKNDVKREDDGELKRQKRACYIKEELQNACLETERYCKKYGWWTGRSRCKSWGVRCSKYGLRVVTTKHCY